MNVILILPPSSSLTDGLTCGEKSDANSSQRTKRKNYRPLYLVNTIPCSPSPHQPLSSTLLCTSRKTRAQDTVLSTRHKHNSQVFIFFPVLVCRSSTFFHLHLFVSSNKKPYNSITVPLSSLESSTGSRSPTLPSLLHSYGSTFVSH